MSKDLSEGGDSFGGPLIRTSAEQPEGEGMVVKKAGTRVGYGFRIGNLPAQPTSFFRV